MKNTRTSSVMLLFIIGVLLVTNIAMLFWFVLPTAKSAENVTKIETNDSGMAPILRKDVGFSQEQIKAYQNIRSEQRQEVRQLFRNIRAAKEKFYDQISQNNVPDSLKNLLADSIAYHQKNLDQHMFQYFEKIRSLSTPEQLPRFDTAIRKVVQKMINGRNRSKK